MFNFKNGTALAVQQDQYLQLYTSGGKLSSLQIRDMEQNLWVATASKLAPGNLVIRQWALLDLFNGLPEHTRNIMKAMDILAFKGINDTYRLWAEGYSYFCYTMDILELWLSRFENGFDISIIKGMTEEIKQGFIKTSYLRNGVWYPAPFGDLRDSPLKSDLQIKHDIETKAVSNVTLNYISSENRVWYFIKGHPIGLNTHIPKNDSTITLVNGYPMNFKFYEGYNKKYKNSREEFKDTFDPKRLASIPC